MKFIINAYPYNENSGGIIALHRLCHIINEHTEHQAFLFPISVKEKLSRLIRNFFKKRKFKTNKKWNTPVLNSIQNINDYVVIYPEVISGNPLSAEKIIRWFLHNPGHFTGEINYGEGELYFKYTSGFDKYIPRNNSYISNKLLTVVYYPSDIYMKNKPIYKDIDVSYIVRKGKDIPFIHPNNSVCIDGLSHIETANILQRSKKFISYDLYTAYSRFAALAECESYVVPDEKLSLKEWLPNEVDRYGVAYGFSDAQLSWAKNTRNQLVAQVERQNMDAINSVEACLKDIEIYFNIRD